MLEQGLVFVRPLRHTQYTHIAAQGYLELLQKIVNITKKVNPCSTLKRWNLTLAGADLGGKQIMINDNF